MFISIYHHNHDLEDKLSIIISFCIFAVVFFISPINLPIVDSAYFADIAKNLVIRHSFCSNFELEQYNPGFPFVLSFFYLLFGKYYFMKVYLGCAAAAMFYVVYALLNEFYDKKTSIIASIFVQTIPLVLYNQLRLLSDIFFTITLSITVLFYIKFLKSNRFIYLLIFSLFSALAWATRFTGIILIIAILFHYLIFKLLLNSDKNTKKYLIYLLIFLLISTSLVGIWSIRNYNVGLGQEGIRYANLIKNAEYIGYIHIEIKDFKNMEILNPPIVIKGFIPIQITNLLRISIFMFIFFAPVFSIVSLYQIIRKFKFYIYNENSIALMIILFFIGFHVLYPAALVSRYLLPVVPMFAVFFSGYLKNKSIKFIAILLIIHIIIVIPIYYWDYNNRWIKLRTEVFKDAGEWIKYNSNINSTVGVVGAPMRAIAYYSDRKVITKKIENSDFIVVSNFNRKSNISIDISKYFLCATFKDRRYKVEIYCLNR